MYIYMYIYIYIYIQCNYIWAVTLLTYKILIKVNQYMGSYFTNIPNINKSDQGP